MSRKHPPSTYLPLHHMSASSSDHAYTASVSFEEEDDDPVLVEYEVYVTPRQLEQSLLLQYPNRDRSKPYGQAGEKPVEMRVKLKTGFVEMDVETNVHSNFDKQKGVQWGESLNQAKETGVDFFGMASGFGKSTRNEHFSTDASTSHANAGDMQQLLTDFKQSNEQGLVLNKQTLGGQIVRPENGKPNYMLGTFRGKELHLTPIDGTVQMRPQFHHVDAQSQVARNKYWRDRDALESGRTEPRLMQQLQVAKSSTDGEEFNITQTMKYLTDAAEEPWTKLQYHNEESEEAYASYHEKLFFKDTIGAPQLKTVLTDEHYLDIISAPKADPSGKTKKRPMTKKQQLVLDDESDIGLESHPATVASSNERTSDSVIATTDPTSSSLQTSKAKSQVRSRKNTTG